MLDFNNRENITDFFSKLEKELPVDKWTYDNIEVWPFIKVSLFFYLLGKRKNIDLISISNNRPKNTSSLSEKIKKFVFKITHPIKFKRFIDNLNQKDIVIYSHKTYRTEFNGKNFNKFFDPLIENGKIGNKKNIYFIEDFYNYDINTLMHSELIMDVRLPFNYFLSGISKKKIALKGEKYDEFLNNYLSEKIFDDFKKVIHPNNFSNFFKAIYYKSLFFEKILKKVSPQKLYITCYYCNTSIPVTIAAKKLGIEVIEMQHGVMESHHISYGVWYKSPKEGYKMLPDKIWNWDSKSKEIIEKNFETVKAKPFIGGNPWVDYFQNNNITYPNSNFILYTLQPFIEYPILFSKSLIKAVNELDYTWYLRLHPRQLNEKEKMINYLKENGADMDKINFDEATDNPLPLLIIHCKLHITQFSSCTIEAALLDKKTLLLDKDAKLYFDNYIKNNLAEYINIDSIYDKIRGIDF